MVRHETPGENDEIVATLDLAQALNETNRLLRVGKDAFSASEAVVHVVLLPVAL